VCLKRTRPSAARRGIRGLAAVGGERGRGQRDKDGSGAAPDRF
jgi:hypothetical protein